MKTRQHHNNKGHEQIKQGYTRKYGQYLNAKYVNHTPEQLDELADEILSLWYSQEQEISKLLKEK